MITRRALVICMLVGCGGGGVDEDESKARAEQCERMRDHLVDLRLASAQHLDKDLDQHRVALKQAMGAAFIESCTKDMTEAQVVCVVGAKDAETATACTTAASK